MAALGGELQAQLAPHPGSAPGDHSYFSLEFIHVRSSSMPGAPPQPRWRGWLWASLTRFPTERRASPAGSWEEERSVLQFQHALTYIRTLVRNGRSYRCFSIPLLGSHSCRGATAEALL
jgi:hypothetical protein